ncbi:hypothetical protein Tco_1417501 [Tanacetum coccineum]
MGDANPIRTLGDYSKPSHKGYRNTIELLEGKNVVPFRSDTIREIMRLCCFQFSLRDQARDWLERLPTEPSHMGVSTTHSLFNSFHQEGPQNFATISLYSHDVSLCRLPLFRLLVTSAVRDSLAYLKLSLGLSIYRVWKLVDTPYRAM